MNSRELGKYFRPAKTPAVEERFVALASKVIEMAKLARIATSDGELVEFAAKVVGLVQPSQVAIEAARRALGRINGCGVK